MGRRVPKTGIRIGNSLTWKTTFHSLKKNMKRTWYFEEALIKKIIKGVNRKFNYYVSDMVIHVFPKTKSNEPILIHIKYLVWSEENVSSKNAHYITSQVILPILAYVFKEYEFKFDVKVINKKMISRNAEIFGDYMGDKLMAEPHRDKQIIGREFKIATEEIKRYNNKS